MKRPLFLLAPMGAIAFPATILTPYRTLTIIGDMLDRPSIEAFEKQASVVLGLGCVGFVGAIFLAVGLVAILQHRCEMTRAEVVPHLIAAALLLLGSATAVLGVLQLMKSFNTLATAANVIPGQFLNDVSVARWPLIFGAICLAIGAIVVFWSTRPASDATNYSPTGGAGSGFFGVMAAAILVLSCLWNLSSVYNLQGFDSSTNLRPNVFAAIISQVLLSTLGAVSAFAAFAVAVLLKGLSASQIAGEGGRGNKGKR